MGTVKHLGWSKPGDDIPQPTSIVTGRNLRKRSPPQTEVQAANERELAGLEKVKKYPIAESEPPPALPTLDPGAARIVVTWGYEPHEIVLTSRNWSRIKRGGKLKIRSRGFSEDGPQWEYWSFDGGLDGNLLVEYGEGGGVGFDGKPHDPIVEEG